MTTRQKKALFPDGVDPKQIKITEEGIYSVCRPNHADAISRSIKYHLTGERVVITDATANVGGNTINFAKHFTRVNAVECNPKNYEALNHNVRLYKLRNVRTALADYTKIYSDLKQDVVYIDPPWGEIGRAHV